MNVFSKINKSTSPLCRQWSDFGEDNHLVCDCSALWLYEWMIARPLQSSVVCAEPAQYNGVDLRALQRASFGCSKY